MNVAQLRKILEHLPDDLPVVVASGPAGAQHIGEVGRSPRSRTATLPDGRRWPPTVFLRGATGIWYGPEPPFELHGRFRRAAGLEAALADLGAISPP